MKRFSILVTFFLTVGFSSYGINDTTQHTIQTIRYSTEGANEVFLVWGVNSWQVTKKEFWPSGTYQKKGLLYSPMKKENGYFSCVLRVPKNTMLDYVFWISKSFKNKPSDTWDLNLPPYKDYHTWVVQDNIVLVNSTLKVRPKENFLILDFGVPVLSNALLLLILFLVIRKWKKYRAGEVGYTKIIFSSSVILFLGLLFIRTSIAGTGWELYNHFIGNLGLLLRPGLYDFIFVACLTLLFLPFTLISRKYSGIKKTIVYSYPILCLLFLIIGLLNIRIVEILGKPFTYQWLYYSDFLLSADAESAISSNVDAKYTWSIFTVCLSAFILWYILLQITEMIKLNKPKKILALAGLTGISAIYLLYAGSIQNEKQWKYDKLSNPIIAFLASANPFSSGPELFTMKVPDSLQYIPATHNSASTKIYAAGKIKNIILFVLESTPAEYISAYGSKYAVTPELTKYLDKALIFENIYAHAPATNNSLVSLLGSVYPWLSYATITQQHPDVVLPTISSELKKKGYRTAFFNSADNRFQRAGEFLSYRNFDTISDCRNNTCPTKQFKTNDEARNFLDGKDDECTLENMMTWISLGNDPFFAMMWTYQTHYPYFNSGNEITYEPLDPVFNRYLNAVHHSDAVFGEMMQSLIKKGLFESTLVVLVGDHGEAFGRHEQTTHASRIYEENLHVPCLFFNPAFTTSGNDVAKNKYNGIGGLVDIAPTIMSLIGGTIPDKWQGGNLFAASGNDRVYFFSPWSDYLFGYREGDRKYIFNATKNLTEIYDLKADPFESQDLSAKLSKQSTICHHRLAGWVQFVNRFTTEAIKKK